jgi:hypothetical protein
MKSRLVQGIITETNQVKAKEKATEDFVVFNTKRGESTLEYTGYD